ncbi:MAG: hypothetical protein AAFO94_13690, partial [Bacteroidota bacterium]
MNADKYCYYLRNPAQLAEVSFQELRNLVLQYPYCQSLRYLLLKKSQLENRHDYAELLEQAATYSTDRKHLYRLIHQQVEAFEAQEDYLLGADILELKDISSEEVEAEKILLQPDTKTPELQFSIPNETSMPPTLPAVDGPVSEVPGAAAGLDGVEEVETLDFSMETELEAPTTSEQEPMEERTPKAEIPAETPAEQIEPEISEPEELLQTEEINSTEEPSALSDEAAPPVEETDSVEPPAIKPENEDLLSLLAKYSREHKVVKRVRRVSTPPPAASPPSPDDTPATPEEPEDKKDDEEDAAVAELFEDIEDTPMETAPVAPQATEEEEIIEVENLDDDPMETSPPTVIKFEITRREDEDEKTPMEDQNKKNKSSAPRPTSFEDVLEHMLNESDELLAPAKKKKTKSKKPRKKKKVKVVPLANLRKEVKATDKEDALDISPVEEEIIEELKASIEDFKQQKKLKDKRKKQGEEKKKG